jgi:hypothetical protein
LCGACGELRIHVLSLGIKLDLSSLEHDDSED